MPVLLLLLLIAPLASFAATCTSKANGSWNNAGTWDCTSGTTPAAGDTVILASPYTVSLNNNNRTAAALTVNSGATLNDDGQDLTVNGNVVNNGTFGTNGGALIMRGANSTLSGNGTFNDTDVQTDASGIVLASGSTLNFTNGAQLRVGRDNPGTLTLNGTVTAVGLASGDRILRVYEGSSAIINGTIDAPNGYIRIEQNASLTNNGSVSVQYLDSDGNNSTAVWTQGANSSLTLSQTPNNEWRGTLSASANNNTVTYSADVTPLTPSGNTYYNIGHPVCAKVSGFTILGSSPCGPTVISINRASTDPTAPNTSVSWTVTFSASVTGVDTSDFSLVSGGAVTGASLSSVTGSGTSWTVTANTGSGSGTLGLNLVDNDSIVDGSSKALGGTGTGNGNFTGQLYTVAGPAVCTTSLSGVVNTYYPPANTGTVAAGSASITLGTPAGNATPLAANDLVLIIQMQDATINATDSNAYGANNGTGSGATSLGNSGLYEYKLVQSFSGGVATFTTPLVNSYTRAVATATTSGQKTFQVIRVPVLATYTLSAAPSALAWNGSVGGVLAFDVTGTLTFSGNPTISMDGMGFRGGVGRSRTSGSGLNTAYRTNAGSNGANGAKGEGIAGTSSTTDNASAYGYPNGSHARGAPANAGGGGTDGNPAANDQNSGGGGGAGYGSGGIGGIPWCSSFNTGVTPAYNCPDGSHPSNNFNNGGVGGTGVAQTASRLTMGGGGGAATSNNGYTVDGAAGGGLIFVRAGSLSGNATFSAKGANAPSTACNDGTGGAGGGGAVLLHVASGSGLNNITANVSGGNGGSNLIPPCSSGPHGPGGGGGGGYVITTSTLGTCTASGGAAGVTYRNGTLFGNYGATAGSSGACATGLVTANIPGAAVGSGPCASSVASFLVDAPGSASTCGTAGGSPAAPIVTVTAKAGAGGAGNTITTYTGTIALTTSTGRGTWAKVSGQADGTLTGSNYTFVTSDNGDAQFYLVSGVGEDLTVTAADGSTTGTSGTVQFRDNAFVVTPTDALGTTVVAGRDHAMSIEFWKKDATSGLCGIETSYTGSHNLDAWYATDISHPAGALAPSIGGATLPSADPGGQASYNLPLTFTDGAATFNLTTSDVGKYDLNFQDDTRTFSSTLDIAGSSSTLTVKPFALHASVAGNPAASAASGTVFTTAGTSFSATVRGVLWQAADDANNDGTPDLTGAALNAALANNTVATHFAWATTLTPDTTAGSYTPASGTLGALSNGSIAQASYSSGAATAATLQYAEVGSFTLLANVADYLGSGIALAANAGVVGRFRPHHFLLTPMLANRQGAGCTPAATFTHMGEPFRVSLALVAEQEGGGTTVNYDTPLGFARLDPATANWLTSGANSTLGMGAINGTTPLSSRLSVSGTPSGSWSAGTATLVADIILSRPTTTTADATWGAYGTLQIGAVPQDADGTTLLASALNLDADASGTNERKLAGTTALRLGRLRLVNFYGSELLAPRVEYRMEYWDGTHWATNSLDACTAIVAGNIATGGLAVNSLTALSGGIGYIRFDAAAAGSYDIALNLGTGAADTSCNANHPATTGASLPWLQGHWSGSCGGTATWQQDPNARIKLGSPKAPYIYMRERY